MGYVGQTSILHMDGYLWMGVVYVVQTSMLPVDGCSLTGIRMAKEKISYFGLFGFK